MVGALNNVNVAALLLRARIAVLRFGVAACVAVALCAAGVAAWVWLLPQRAAQVHVLARPLPAPASLVTVPPPPSADQNLATFYDVLGEKRYAEQQVKVLFDLAARSSLALTQGEYTAAYNKASSITTYQIVLPVKGPYQSIWQFAMQGLREMPFASLDEIGFRRETIAEPTVEARLRFTLYLKDAAP
ncbi:hypothetical protein GJ698_00835 [Pseudoduganella sp. FT26W]|uniref:Transmembrane protein n=1 Tax=Duganella aquatilis TaxID=2666082 RepID=A0A844D3B6_9BURK|nr:hypothetical protein [Duganella aquatilis]MRW82636.1 hypothetical protein [Duganella aquatilis]